MILIFLSVFFCRIEDGESWRVAVEPTNYKKVKNKWQSITLPSLNVNKGKRVPFGPLKQATSNVIIFEKVFLFFRRRAWSSPG